VETLERKGTQRFFAECPLCILSVQVNTWRFPALTTSFALTNEALDRMIWKRSLAYSRMTFCR
jgi:hypothetical protein